MEIKQIINTLKFCKDCKPNENQNTTVRPLIQSIHPETKEFVLREVRQNRPLEWGASL